VTGQIRLPAVIRGAALRCWVVLSHSGGHPSGKAVGTDVTRVYAAPCLALTGQALDVYGKAAHGAAQTVIFGRDIGYATFFHPPICLLLCLPLGLVPSLMSLALWQAGTLMFDWRVARQFGGSRLGALPLFAFPAVIINIGHGQNAFLRAGLFGAGILWLDRRPVLTGIRFGALA
jgi:alpha-1,2-mannosyltransferase